MAAPLSPILPATWLVSSSTDWAVTSLLGVWDPTQHSHHCIPDTPTRPVTVRPV